MTDTSQERDLCAEQRTSDLGDRRAALVRVVVVDDHEVVRLGIRSVLDADEFDVVGEAADAAHALRAIRRCAPDIAVVDHHLPDGDGIELCSRIANEFGDVRCIVLSSAPSDLDLIAAFEAGAVACIAKATPLHDLPCLVRDVAQGRVYLDSAEIRLARRRLRDTDAGHVDSLTPREREIFRLIRHGRTNREIAAVMSISDKTVKNYVSNLLTKLGVSRRAEVAAIAGRLEAHSFADSGRF